VFRQGHLSEQAIADALMTADRPAHLDRCDLCADRALEMGRWLDAVKTAAVETADEVFPADRLAAQQGQILRRLEQLDEPSRVIAFPHARPLPRETGRRRIAPAWVGVAAAAGLIVGAIGGQMSARLDPPTAFAPQATAVPAARPADVAAEVDPSFLDMDFDTTPEQLLLIDGITPTLAAIQSSGG
jgi:hypothetical protein